MGRRLCCSAMAGGAALSAPALCFLSSPPPAQSSDCFRHAQLRLLSPSLCKKQETKETPLPSASYEKWGGDLSHAVMGCQRQFSVGLEYLSGSEPGSGPAFPADQSLMASQCGHLGLGNRASAETPKVLGVGMGESRMGTSRWRLSFQLEASGANCSTFSFDRGDDLSGNMWAHLEVPTLQQLNREPAL